MSLSANGMPDNLIEEGLKQPNHIKISFKKRAKEITGHVTPDHAWFGAEYFLTYMLPNFKSKILTWLLAEQMDDGPLLFNLMGQCFHDVGLTKWTSVIAKRCPDNEDCTKANFDKCIRDYLEAIAGFPNVGDQLICWLCTAKKPTLMPMHKFMQRQVQLLSYLKGGYLCRTIEVPMAQEKTEQNFFAQPKAHQFKFADLNKRVPTDLLKLITFFEQWQATNSAAGVLEKITKDKKHPKENKTAHLPAAHSRELSYQQNCHHKYCNIHQSNWCDCDDQQPDYHHQDNWRHKCPCCDNKDWKCSKSYKKKNDYKRDHFNKKSNEAMHNNQSSLSSMGNSSRKGVALAQDLLPPLRSCSWSCSHSSSRSYDNHHVDNDDCKPSAAPKRGYLYSSKCDDGGRIHWPDKSNAVIATFFTPMTKRGKHTPK
jgi:hypothetical protein